MVVYNMGAALAHFTSSSLCTVVHLALPLAAKGFHFQN
jgi:hypothetical protein